MSYTFDNERPIYLQIYEIVKLEIVSGKLKSGQKLLSVRELALTYKVNPNTIQKALVELENDKLIYTERTNGKFVTDDQKLINKYKTNMAIELTHKYISDMNDLGIDSSSLSDYLNMWAERFVQFISVKTKNVFVYRGLFSIIVR